MTIRWRNGIRSWGTAAKSFHWLVAILVLAQFAIGKIAEDMALSPAKLDAFVWHKSLGVTVLLLVVLRLAWRLYDSPPAAPDGVPPWETRIATSGHWLLYGLLFAVPLSGWWVSDASRVPFEAYFVIPMPDFAEADRDAQASAETVHGILTSALLVLVLIHIAAALRHHFGLRNDVLRRMLPGDRK